MFTPKVAETVCTLSPLSQAALKLMVLQAHRIKLPLPPADRDQWCMRLDSIITGHNALVGKWAKISNGVRDNWRAAQEVDGKSYEGPELFELRDQLRKRAEDSQANLLSIAAMLVLDERVNSTEPALKEVPKVPEVPTPSPAQPALRQSEVVDMIRAEREKEGQQP